VWKASRTSAAGVPANRLSIFLGPSFFSTIQEFTTNCKQWDDMTAAYFPLRGIIAEKHSPPWFNWAKLCLFSFDLRTLLQ